VILKHRNIRIGLYINNSSITAIKVFSNSKMCTIKNITQIMRGEGNLQQQLLQARKLINYQQEPVISSLSRQHLMTQEVFLEKPLKRKEAHIYLQKKTKQLLNIQELQLDYTIQKNSSSSPTTQRFNIIASHTKNIVFLSAALKAANFNLRAIDSENLAEKRAVNFLQKNSIKCDGFNKTKSEHTVALGLALWSKRYVD
jgi:Tfp pilus assembly PilM family ATPase